MTNSNQVLISQDNLHNQHFIVKKFAQRWRGPYVVTKVHNNTTYNIREFDGVKHQSSTSRNGVKLSSKL